MKIIKRIIRITLVVAGIFMAMGSNIPVLAADSGRDDFIASPIQYNLAVDGKSASLWGYVIADDVYFKLRDLAMVLNDTEKHFEVAWTADDGNKQVQLSPQLSYTPTGGELSEPTPGTKTIAHVVVTRFYIDDRLVPLRAFTVNDVHYIMLSDLAANMRLAAACDEEKHMAAIDTQTYDTGLYSFLLPEGWKAEGVAAALNFTRSSDSVGSLSILAYDPDHPVSQFQGNHRETLSSEKLSGFAYPSAKALIRATQPAASNDDSWVDELHIYIMLANLRCAFDFSFDSAKVDEQTAIKIAKSLVPKEKAIKMNPTAAQWAQAVKDRDGRAQYELLSAELQSAVYEYYEPVGWVTGVSSPWVESYAILFSENYAVVFYEMMTSDDSGGGYNAIDLLSFAEENNQLRISGLDGVNDPRPYIGFNRYARSDTWEKSKRLWFTDLDDRFWLPLYNQNYFVIVGASQGSKIFAAIGLDRLERRTDVDYAVTDSMIMLALYNNIISITSAGGDVVVILEPKQAGYDALEITRSELSRLAHKKSDEGAAEYSFVFTNLQGEILHQETVLL